QPMAMYPEKYIFDVGGHQAVLAKDLVAELIKQATQFNPAVVLGEEVEELQREGDVWKLSTAKGVHYSKTVVITAGMGAFSPKKLPLKNLVTYDDALGVEYAVVELDDYPGKRVLVVGGCDSEVVFANALEPFVAQRTVTH